MSIVLIDSGHPLAQGLVGFWPLDEGSGSTVINRSGRAFNGSITGANWQAGDFGKELYFNGSNQYVNWAVDSTADWLNSDVGAVAFWAKRQVTSGIDTFLAICDSTDGNYWGLVIRHSSSFELEVLIREGTSWKIIQVGTTVLAKDVWNHIAVSQDGSGYKAYINGVLESMSDAYSQTSQDTGAWWGAIANQDRMRLGYNADASPDNPLTGRLRDVGLWQRPLSQVELNYLQRGSQPFVRTLPEGFLAEAEAAAGNDFSTDANCKALWRLENGALTTDSKGTNTLTASTSSPTSETTDYKEGLGSGDFESSSSQNLYISDASLDAGFPLKNGDTTKEISVCFWAKYESLPGVSSVMFNKAHSSKRSFSVWTHTTTGTRIKLAIGYNGGVSWEFVEHGTTIVASRWYHVGATFKDSDKSWKIRVWDDTAGALLGGAEASGTATNNINVEDAPVSVGSGRNVVYQEFFDGLLDEVVVFNDILTSDEIDQIRAGTYGATAAGDVGSLVNGGLVNRGLVHGRLTG